MLAAPQSRSAAFWGNQRGRTPFLAVFILATVQRGLFEGTGQRSPPPNRLRLNGTNDQVGEATHHSDRDEGDGSQVPNLELGHWPSVLSLQPYVSTMAVPNLRRI